MLISIDCLYLFIFQIVQKVERFFYDPPLFFHFYNFQTIHYVSSSQFSFQPHNLPFNQQTLPTSYSRQTPYMVSSRHGPIHLL
jgi:hypothetical protein